MKGFAGHGLTPEMMQQIAATNARNCEFERLLSLEMVEPANETEHQARERHARIEWLRKEMAKR